MHLLETVLVASHHFLRWVRRALVAALLWRVRLLVMIVLLRAIAGRTAVSQRNSIDVVSHERRICTDVRLSVALLFLARSVRSEGHVYVHIAPVPHWRWRISMDAHSLRTLVLSKGVHVVLQLVHQSSYLELLSIFKIQK